MTSGLERILNRSQGKQSKEIKPATKPRAGTGAALGKALDRFLIDNNTREGIKKSVGFSPSGTSTCARYWYIKLTGAPTDNKVDGRLQRIFDNGHAVHERWFKYFDDMGILIDEEVPIVVKDPVPIIGFADALIEWEGQKLVEMKSISMEGFQYRKIYKKPKEEHLNQIQLYLYALKIDKGFVIYEDKSSQNYLIFEIEKDDALIEKLFRRFKKWYKNVQEGTLPARPYKRDSKQCGYCEFETYCWDKLGDEQKDNQD